MTTLMRVYVVIAAIRAEVKSAKHKLTSADYEFIADKLNDCYYEIITLLHGKSG